jgi:hypothetical protein
MGIEPDGVLDPAGDRRLGTAAHPAGQHQCPAIMIGERCADFMLGSCG